MEEGSVMFKSTDLTSKCFLENPFPQSFREEVSSVKAELESMTAFLRAADAAEDDDEEIRVWVKQVREVAFDAEDILDEYLYRFAEQHQRRHQGGRVDPERDLRGDHGQVRRPARR